MTTRNCPACLKPLIDPNAAACPFCSEPLPAPKNDNVLLAPRPMDSAIEVWHATPERRIFDFRQRRGGYLFVFALCWLAFVLLATSSMIGGAGKAGNDFLTGLCVGGAFWLIGFVFLFAALRQRFLRVTLLLERERLVVQKNLLGWKSVEETPLTGASVADLVVAHQENYKPVFAVRVCGVERKIQFGAALDTADKNWLVDEINGFLAQKLPLGPLDPAIVEVQEADDADLEGRLAAAGLTIEHPDAATLRLSRAVSQLPRGGSVILAAGCTAFTGLWYAVLAACLTGALQAPFPMNIIGGLFALPFLLAGLLPLAVAVATLWGKVAVEIGAEEVLCRYAVGPFRLTRRLPTDAIDGMGADDEMDNPRWRSRPATGAYRFVVRAGGKSMTLPLVASPGACEALAELLRRLLPKAAHAA